MTVKVDDTYREHAEQHLPDEREKLFNEAGGTLSADEEYLFTRVVELAETYGEQIVPIVVPSNNAWYAIAKTAREVEANEVLLGWSGRIPTDVQLQQMAMMWALASDGAERPLKVRIISREGEELAANI